MQVLQALPARRPEVREIRSTGPVHVASAARVLRVHAAAVTAVLPTVDGRRCLETFARPEQSSRHIVDRQRVLGPGLIW